MNIKEILVAGGHIQFSYKEKENEWVGTAHIFGFAGGCGIKPKIIVQIPTIDLAPGGMKEFKWDEVDIAIEEFKSVVFRPKNLMYKMSESVIELYNKGETEIDLDDEEDLKKVRILQSKKQNE